MKKFIMVAVLMATALFGAMTPGARAGDAWVDGFSGEKQETNVWCWAACAQMVLEAQGEHLSQSEIVAKVYGAPVVRTGDPALVLRQFGQCPTQRGAPTVKWLIDELTADRPVIVGYQTGPGMSHVVVAHKVHWEDTMQGPLVTAVTIYDPFTDRDIVVRGREFAAVLIQTWYFKKN